MTPAYDIRCVGKTLVAPGVYDLSFEKPDIAFRAGQFVLWDVPLLADPSDVQPRAYSIASAPGDPELRFVVKQVVNGRASAFVEHALEPGSILRVKGPFGRFTMDVEDGSPLVFVGTGTGVAPLRSQMRWTLKERNDTRSIHLVKGVLTADHFFWEDEWKALEKEHDNVCVHASFLSGEADWHGRTGTVHERLASLVRELPANPHVFLCGPADMVNSARTLCAELSIPERQVHWEQYV